MVGMPEYPTFSVFREYARRCFAVEDKMLLETCWCIHIEVVCAACSDNLIYYSYVAFKTFEDLKEHLKQDAAKKFIK